MSLLSLCQWLANTSWSIGIHESRYGYSIIESVHVLTLCLFLGLAVMLDLRLLGVSLRGAPVYEVVEQLLPWMKAGFAVMAVSGILLFTAIPVRTYQNIFFRLKVIMLIAAAVNVWVFHSTVYREVADWGTSARPPRRARIAAGLSLALWAGIVIAGRMIAYNWFDCDRKQSAVMTFMESCGPPTPDE